jgi:hypothetical protein
MKVTRRSCKALCCTYARPFIAHDNIIPFLLSRAQVRRWLQPKMSVRNTVYKESKTYMISLPSTIRAVRKIVASFEYYMLRLFGRIDIFKYIRQIDPREKGGRETGCPPRKSQRLLNYILLFATVSGTDQSNRDSDYLELFTEVGQTQSCRISAQSTMTPRSEHE